MKSYCCPLFDDISTLWTARTGGRRRSGRSAPGCHLGLPHYVPGDKRRRLKVTPSGLREFARDTKATASHRDTAAAGMLEGLMDGLPVITVVRNS
jgi:hypothetical protein